MTIDFEDHSSVGSGPIVFAFASENDMRFEWGHFLESIGVPHVLFRDSLDRWYMYGIEGLGDMPTTVTFIQKLIVGRPSISLGLSKGGHAALQYAKLARIQRVIAISPVTVTGPEGYDDFEAHWHSRVGRSLPHPIIDLKPFYAQGWNPEVQIFFSDGESCELDRRMAERLNCGSLHFVPGHAHGGRHNLATALRDNGMLREVILR